MNKLLKKWQKIVYLCACFISKNYDGSKKCFWLGLLLIKKNTLFIPDVYIIIHKLQFHCEYTLHVHKKLVLMSDRFHVSVTHIHVFEFVGC